MPLMDTGNILVWQALKLYLPPDTKLTSVRRPAEKQLDIIKQMAMQNGYSFTREPTLNDRSSWEEVLRFVRAKGYKVAEPGRSMHERGLAYDLTGPDLKKIEAAILKAATDGRIHLVRPPLFERKNNCIHVEIDEAVLDFEPFDWA